MRRQTLEAAWGLSILESKPSLYSLRYGISPDSEGTPKMGSASERNALKGGGEHIGQHCGEAACDQGRLRAQKKKKRDCAWPAAHRRLGRLVTLLKEVQKAVDSDGPWARPTAILKEKLKVLTAFRVRCSSGNVVN